MSFSDVALRPARKLSFLVELIRSGRVRTSRLRQENDGFSPTRKQAEPLRQRLNMGCGEKDSGTMPNRFIYRA